MLIPRIVRVVKRFRDGPPSAATLIAANLWQLAGVLFLGWDVLQVALVFWAENAVIGFWNFFKILMAGKPRRSSKKKMKDEEPRVFAAAFFAAHYGGFTLMHGILLVAVLNPDLISPAISWTEIGHRVNTPGFWIGGAFLFASHGYSFFSNYVGRGEYRHTTPSTEMFRVYGRIFVLHVAVLFGGFLIQSSGLPRLFAVVLVPLKIVLDLLAHLGERRRYASAARKAPAPSNV